MTHLSDVARARPPGGPIPQHADAESERCSRKKASSAAQRGRILIVDDEPQFGQTLRMLLGLSHEATYTPSAREALRWIQEGHRYDVILCDLMMAEMQGEQFCHELTSRAPELARRVIFMSGGAYTPDSLAFVSRMVHPLLLKPFKHTELETLLRPLLPPA
jgi:CheY-like chemotaxis protein